MIGARLGREREDGEQYRVTGHNHRGPGDADSARRAVNGVEPTPKGSGHRRHEYPLQRDDADDIAGEKR